MTSLVMRHLTRVLHRVVLKEIAVPEQVASEVRALEMEAFIFVVIRAVIISNSIIVGITSMIFLMGFLAVDLRAAVSEARALAVASTAAASGMKRIFSEEAEDSAPVQERAGMCLLRWMLPLRKQRLVQTR